MHCVSRQVEVDAASRGHGAGFVDEDEVFAFVVFLAGGEVVAGLGRIVKNFPNHERMPTRRIARGVLIAFFDRETADFYTVEVQSEAVGPVDRMFFQAGYDKSILDLPFINGHFVALRIADIPFVVKHVGATGATGDDRLLVDAVASAIIPELEFGKVVRIGGAVHVAHLAMQVPIDRGNVLGGIADEVANGVVLVVGFNQKSCGK